LTSVTKFQDLEAWQDARTLVGMVYKASNCSPLDRDFGLRDQLQRAAVSIMANIAEGFGRGRNKELIHFLIMARGSCSEVQSHLYVALDAELIPRTDFDAMSEQTDKTARKISAFIRYLQQTAKAGQKTKVAQQSNEPTK